MRCERSVKTRVAARHVPVFREYKRVLNDPVRGKQVQVINAHQLVEASVDAEEGCLTGSLLEEARLEVFRLQGDFDAATQLFANAERSLANEKGGKGQLAVGADADLTLVRLDDPWELRTEDLEYRHRHSPFVGTRLTARVVRTIVRGVTVAGEGVANQGPIGRLVTP